MSEYSYNDIIMDPEDPRLEGAIGKECYFSDYPTKLLESARYNSALYLDCLTNISKEKACPFSDKNGSGWALIIIKKEEPKKYVPFETLDEFIESYKKVEERINYSKAEDYIASCGMWLKDKDRDVYCLVTEIWNYGVVVGDSELNTTKDGDGYFTINEVTKWKRLFREYTFLDNSPCGKEVEE